MVVVHIIDGCLGKCRESLKLEFFDVGRLALRAQEWLLPKRVRPGAGPIFRVIMSAGRLWKNIFPVQSISPTSSANVANCSLSVWISMKAESTCLRYRASRTLMPSFFPALEPENHRHGRCRSCSHFPVTSAGLSRGANAMFPMPSQRGAPVAVILCSNRARARAMPHDFTPH